jgi:hypothetical protein
MVKKCPRERLMKNGRTPENKGSQPGIEVYFPVVFVWGKYTITKYFNEYTSVAWSP